MKSSLMYEDMEMKIRNDYDTIMKGWWYTQLQISDEMRAKEHVHEKTHAFSKSAL